MLSYRILCAGHFGQPSERHDRCDAGGKLQPPPASHLSPPINHRSDGVLVGPCGVGEARGVGPGGESRVLAAGPTPALPLRANPDSPHLTSSRFAAIGLRVVDTGMIPPPSAIPAPHPPSGRRGGRRGGGSVCARTYRRRPRNTGAAAGILSISPGGATTRRTNFLSLLVDRCFAGGAQTDRNAPASRAVLSNLRHRNSRRADGRDSTRIHPLAATFRHCAQLGVGL